MCEVETKVFVNALHVTHTQKFDVIECEAVELHFPTTPFAEIRFHSLSLHMGCGVQTVRLLLLHH